MTSVEELRRLQAEFADAVSGGDDARFARHLAGDAGTARARLALYRDAIAANRLGALRSAFPVVARLVGDGFFAEAARRYASATPPGEADLNRYGATFAAFLAAYPHAADLPWLCDVARLEWARQESLMAPEAPALDYEALARVPDEDQPALRFALHPSLRLVRSSWPVLAIWEANQDGRDGAAEREEGADDVLVWREDGRVRLARLEPPEAAFVDALAAGIALGQAAGLDERWDFTRALRGLAARGLLTGFSAA